MSRRQLSEFINIKYNLTVRKEQVRKYLKMVAPEGVRERWKKVIRRRIYETDGPGDVFYTDGNDKLKQWDFAILGCIDGFSRKILWLRVTTTNNDPIVIANYYLDFISRSKFCSKVLRMDRGNENIYYEDLQLFLSGDPESFL